MNQLIKDLKSLIDETIDENSTICSIKQDVSTLKQDVSTLKQDVSTLKQDVSTLKQDVSTLSMRIHENNIRIEETNRKIDLLIDAVLPAKQRAAQVDEVFAKVDNHESRITAVEFYIKDKLV